MSKTSGLTIEEALSALKKGKTIRRKSWAKGWAIKLEKSSRKNKTKVLQVNLNFNTVEWTIGYENEIGFSPADLIATDWEVTEDFKGEK